MTAAAVLELLIVALNHTAELSAIYQKAKAESRDLTPEEIAAVRAIALAANQRLADAIAA